MGCFSANENKQKINNKNNGNIRQTQQSLKNEQSIDKLSNASLNINQKGDINRYNEIKEFEAYEY